MTSVHRTLAFVLVLLALGGAIWAAHSWLRQGSINPRLITLTIAASALVGVQAVIGIALAIAGNRPADGATHFVVGPLTLFVLPLARRLGRGRDVRAGAAILTAAWVILLILSLRAAGSGAGLG